LGGVVDQGSCPLATGLAGGEQSRLTYGRGVVGPHRQPTLGTDTDLYHDKSLRPSPRPFAIFAYSTQLSRADQTDSPIYSLTRTVSFSLFIVFWHSTSFPFCQGMNRPSRHSQRVNSPWPKPSLLLACTASARLRRKRRQDV
jgi:hypothetical protein